MDMQTTTKSKWSIITWIIISVLALVFSIIAICRSFYRTVDIGFDYMGVIVGVLAILVTCLVAWNIHSAIDANHKISEVRNEVNMLQSSINSDKLASERKINKLKSELYDNVVSLNRHILGFEKTTVPLHLLIYMISSIEYLSKSEDFAAADLRIDYYYLMTKDDLELIKKGINKEDNSGLFRLLYEIPNKDKIQNYSKLEELVRLVCS